MTMSLLAEADPSANVVNSAIKKKWRVLDDTFQTKAKVLHRVWCKKANQAGVYICHVLQYCLFGL